MALRIYSTLSRQKEDFQTIEPGKVTHVRLRSDRV